MELSAFIRQFEPLIGKWSAKHEEQRRDGYYESVRWHLTTSPATSEHAARAELVEDYEWGRGNEPRSFYQKRWRGEFTPYGNGFRLRVERESCQGRASSDCEPQSPFTFTVYPSGDYLDFSAAGNLRLRFFEDP